MIDFYKSLDFNNEQAGVARSLYENFFSVGKYDGVICLALCGKNSDE